MLRSRPLVFMLMNAIAAAAAAQGPGPGPGPGGPGGPPSPPPPPADVAKTLGLDPAHTAQFVQIMEEQRTKHRALHDAAAGDREAMRVKMDALHEETLAKLKTVLSADQLAQFEAMRPKPPGPPPHGAPPPNGAAPPPPPADAQS